MKSINIGNDSPSSFEFDFNPKQRSGSLLQNLIDGGNEVDGPEQPEDVEAYRSPTFQTINPTGAVSSFPLGYRRFLTTLPLVG